MKFGTILIFLMFFTILTNFAQTPPLEAGVSQTLAQWRAANYSDVRYKLNITLEKGAPLMKGEIEISVNLTEEGKQNDLILDWRTTQFANDKDKPFANVVAVNDVIDVLTSQSNEHIIVPKGALKTGENIIKINFASPIKTSGAAITRYVDKEDGREYIYSLFVPSDASTAFPVFDQPDLKAKFQLNIIAPKDWKAVSNSSKLIEALPAFKEQAEKFTIAKQKREAELEKRGVASFEFEETKPISTYVFAFAAGNFEVFFETSYIKSNVLIMPAETPTDRLGFGNYIYVRKSQAEKFKQHAAEVFRLNREGLKFLESWFDYKFPFPKYDLVLIPEFPFGGMEHAGCTFLREASVIFPTEPTKNDYVSRANVIFHEAAHQWFGDTVTMRWFDDLWLKEGFAEFMAYKTLEKVMPEYNAWKIFYERNKQAAYLTDVTRGTTPIYQEIPNLSSAKSAYGNIVYRKAPSFLRQAEFYLGEKEFQTAVRAFLKKHEFSNATWQDLVSEFETASKQDLKEWGQNWVTQRGMPKIVYGGMPDEKGKSQGILFIQKDTLDNGDFWTQRFKLFLKYSDGTTKVKDQLVELGDGKLKFSELENKSEPYLIFPNYQDYGYGIFLLDEKSRAYVLANIQTEKDDFLRSMMWGALWDSLRFYELAPEDYVELVIKNFASDSVQSSNFSLSSAAQNSIKTKSRNAEKIPTKVGTLNNAEKIPTKVGTLNIVETDEGTIQTLLSRVSTAMNYYLTDAERDKIAPRLEAVLLDKFTTAETQGQRITFYRAYLNLASSENARQNLKDILSEKSKVAVFQLKTKDKFDIVTRLLILGDKDAPQLLENLEKTETGDDAKRYAYAARAGITTAANKAKYWNDFVGNKDLSESWIEAAFAVWNSPRHAALTLPYLDKALAELPVLKKNRKIFFVNGWLGAFIGGQKSAEALAIVNKFLADNPNLDKDLRLKILENSDGLERAVKIREKFGK